MNEFNDVPFLCTYGAFNVTSVWSHLSKGRELFITVMVTTFEIKLLEKKKGQEKLVKWLEDVTNSLFIWRKIEPSNGLIKIYKNKAFQYK